MKLKKALCIALGTVPFLLLGCHNGSSGNSSDNNMTPSNSDITLYDPAEEVSKFVVTNESGILLHTGVVASNRINSRVEIKLPFELHKDNEYVKLYDSTNTLISIGQLGGFIESGVSTLQMDDDLTALGSWVVLSGYSKDGLNGSPNAAVHALMRNYRQKTTIDPYSLIGAKFVSLQQKGLSEDAARTVIVSKLSSYPSLIQPLEVESEVIDLAMKNENGIKLSNKMVLTNTKNLLVNDSSSKKEIAFLDMVSAREDCYSSEGVFSGKKELASCVTDALKKKPLYKDPGYESSIAKIALGSGHPAAKGASLVISQLKATSMEGIGSAIAGLGLQCTLPEKSVKETSKWLGYLSKAVSFAPVPFSSLGEMAEGVFSGICPGAETSDGSSIMINYMQEGFADIKNKLESIYKAVDDLRIAQDQNFKALNKRVADMTYYSSVEKLKEKVNLMDDAAKDLKTAYSGYNLTQPEAIYQILEDSVKNNHPQAIAQFFEKYRVWYDAVTTSTVNASLFDYSLVNCDQKAETDAQSLSDGFIGARIDYCASGYDKYAMRYEENVINLMDVAHSVLAVQADLLKTQEQLKSLRSRANKDHVNFVSPYSFNVDKYNNVLREEVRKFPVLNEHGADSILEQYVNISTHSYKKASTVTDKKYFLTARDYVYKNLDSEGLKVLDSIAQIPACSTVDYLYADKNNESATAYTRANILDYNLQTKTLSISCGESASLSNVNQKDPSKPVTLRYKLADGPAKLFAGALVPINTSVLDGADTHVSPRDGKDSGTAWEIFKSGGFKTIHHVGSDGEHDQVCAIVNNSEYSNNPGHWYDGVRGYTEDRFAKLGFWLAPNVYAFPLGYGNECMLDGTCGVNNSTLIEMNEKPLVQTPYLSTGFSLANTHSGIASYTASWAVRNNPVAPFPADLDSLRHQGSFGVKQWTNNDITGDIIGVKPMSEQFDPLAIFGYFHKLRSVSASYSVNGESFKPYLAYVKAPILCNKKADNQRTMAEQRKEIVMVGKNDNSVMHPFALQYDIVYTYADDNNGGSVEHKARLVCLTHDCYTDKRQDTNAFEKDQYLHFDDGTNVTLRAHKTPAETNVDSPKGQNTKNLESIHGFVVEMNGGN